MRPQGSSRAPKKSGQISIFILLSLIPMFTLFAFVVNVGVLVNAKISLQNAADFAAYAGAATQARQLTHISHLNYQMRQAYKKFLFKYYVIGNMGLKTFPTQKNSDNQPFDFINPGAAAGQAPFPGAPVVCLSLSKESNACQLGTSLQVLRKDKIPCIPLDPACPALQNAAEQIGKVQQKACKASTVINLETLIMWLYNPEFERKISTSVNLQGMVDEIGLVPEELLLASRIKKVESYINKPGRDKVTSAIVNQLQTSTPDLGDVERTILAFKSAIGNLNPLVFPSEGIEMKELIGSDQQLLNVVPKKVEFQTGVTFVNGGETADALTDCQLNIELFKANPIVGFEKDEKTFTYYAVKLKAKARLFFNPFPFGSPAEDLELTAYAAAMPFGSRIGPKIDPEQFVKSKKIAKTPTEQVDIKVPFLSIDAGNGITWESKSFLGAVHAEIKGGSSAAAASVDTNTFRRGMRIAMLPDKDELGVYNIPNDAESYVDDAGKVKAFMFKYTDSNNTPSDDHTLWAPIVAPNEQDQFNEKVKVEFDNVADTLATIGAGLAPSRSAFKEILLNSVTKLLSGLRQQQRSGFGGFDVAMIPDPLGQNFFSGTPPQGIPGKVTAKAALATSYPTEHDGKYFEAGRDGYSVKFIPLKSLFTQPMKISNITGGTWLPLRDPLGGDAADIANGVEH